MSPVSGIAVGVAVLAGLIVVGRKTGALRGLIMNEHEHRNGHRPVETEKEVREEDSLELHHLPNDAEELAGELAEHLRLRSVERPLSTFLTRASEIEGLIGVGLAVWREKPTSAPFFTIYALSDLSDLRRTDRPSPRAAISDLYDTFEDEIKAGPESGLLTELSFINTRKDRVPLLIKKFPNKLANPISEESPCPDQFSLAFLADCEARSAA